MQLGGNFLDQRGMTGFGDKSDDSLLLHSGNTTSHQTGVVQVQQWREGQHFKMV